MLTFPSNPNTGDVFAPGPGLPSWMWDGDKWTRGSGAGFTLEALADVVVTDLTDGQMLTWDAGVEKWINTSPEPPRDWIGPNTTNSLSWNAAGEFFLNPPQSGIALRINGTYGANAFSFNAPVNAVGLFNSTESRGPYVTWQVNGVGIGDIGSCLANLGFGTAADMSIAVRGNNSLYLSTNARDCMQISGSGNVIVNVPTTGMSLIVNGLAGQQTGSFLVPAGANGVGIGGPGVSPSNWQFNVGNGNDILFRINADGSGWLGPNSVTNLNWTTAGNFVINPPQPGYTALQVYGGFAPTSVASFQAIGTNSPGLYINMTDSPSKVSLIASGYSIPGSFAIGFANGEVLNFGGGSVATFSAPYVQVPNMAATGVTPLPYVVIDGNGNLLRWGATSSLRYKTNIHSVVREQARAVLGKLRAITYTSTIEGDDPERVSYGLIAEEVAKADPRLVYYKEGKPESVIYERVTMLLIPLLQELLGLDEPTGEFSDVSFSAKS